MSEQHKRKSGPMTVLGKECLETLLFDAGFEDAANWLENWGK